ncbi:hypothetical protein PIIN_11094 [Serendipita indica DSM 11827]|uniref:Protein kinase domain-containing protein n=1 Tax=Serendipita indica (strain DSM 11827) TaxID=1109443 RepID=G4U0L8_SERID|nr:hypothetical protein PIIN_11094 [Serendipita indica DSM 11827]
MSHGLNWRRSGKITPKAKPSENMRVKEAADVMYHLQARPDLIAIAGVWVRHNEEYNVLFVDACKVYCSRRVMYTEEVCKRLPYAFVWSLYHPLLDTSITRNTTNDKTTFSITLSDGARYDNLELGFTGSVPGRRTTIFFKPDDACTVIKEQYIDSDRRFFEGSILKIIHASGDFPGFVRLKWSEYVKNGGQRLAVSKRSTTRFKTRLVIQDKGTPLDSVKTVRELLMILYDVLEVTRILHRTWHIIHRDISPGNILVTDRGAHIHGTYAS